MTNALVSFALRSIIADTAVCIGEALILIRYLLPLAVAKCFWNPISSTQTKLPQKQQSFHRFRNPTLSQEKNGSQVQTYHFLDHHIEISLVTSKHRLESSGDKVRHPTGKSYLGLWYRLLLHAVWRKCLSVLCPQYYW